MFKRVSWLLAPLSMVALADGTTAFDPSTIATSVTSQVQAIAVAGAGVLALTIGLSAAWRYAKRFLKG